MIKVKEDQKQTFKIHFTFLVLVGMHKAIQYSHVIQWLFSVCKGIKPWFTE